jgi:metallophosphoesterase superfamily enzyme
LLRRDVDRRETLKWLDFALRRSRPQNLVLARDCVHQLTKVPQTQEQRHARRLLREALVQAESGSAENLEPALQRFAKVWPH